MLWWISGANTEKRECRKYLECSENIEVARTIKRGMSILIQRIISIQRIFFMQSSIIFYVSEDSNAFDV